MELVLLLVGEISRSSKRQNKSNEILIFDLFPAFDFHNGQFNQQKKLFLSGQYCKSASIFAEFLGFLTYNLPEDQIALATLVSDVFVPTVVLDCLTPVDKTNDIRASSI